MPWIIIQPERKFSIDETIRRSLGAYFRHIFWDSLPKPVICRNDHLSFYRACFHMFFVVFTDDIGSHPWLSFLKASWGESFRCRWLSSKFAIHKSLKNFWLKTTLFQRTVKFSRSSSSWGAAFPRVLGTDLIALIYCVLLAFLDVNLRCHKH